VIWDLAVLAAAAAATVLLLARALRQPSEAAGVPRPAGVGLVLRDQEARAEWLIRGVVGLGEGLPVVVLDAGSADGTAEICRQAARRLSGVRTGTCPDLPLGPGWWLVGVATGDVEAAGFLEEGRRLLASAGGAASSTPG
jgi:hypothetical protein